MHSVYYKWKIVSVLGWKLPPTSRSLTLHSVFRLHYLLWISLPFFLHGSSFSSPSPSTLITQRRRQRRSPRQQFFFSPPPLHSFSSVVMLSPSCQCKDSTGWCTLCMAVSPTPGTPDVPSQETAENNTYQLDHAWFSGFMTWRCARMMQSFLLLINIRLFLSPPPSLSLSLQ